MYTFLRAIHPDINEFHSVASDWRGVRAKLKLQELGLGQSFYTYCRRVSFQLIPRRVGAMGPVCSDGSKAPRQ